MKNRVALYLFAPMLVTLGGCTLTKSENPLSPTVAGPLPGVSITAPNPVTPRDGQYVLVSAQPVALVLDNASTSGQRPLSYVFDLALDGAFSNIVYSKSGVTPGDGRTTVSVATTLTNHTYYWRAKAQDGANDGPYSVYATFDIVSGAVYQAPVPVAPANNTSVSTLRPTFTWNNAPRIGAPVGTVMYEVQATDDPSFTVKVSATVPEQGGQTSVTPPQDGLPNKTYYWRVRAFDSGSEGPWSATQSFNTPTTSTGGGGGGGTGGGGGSGWENCGSTPGPDVVRCVSDTYGNEKTPEGAFEITKRVAWLLRGTGAGLLFKNGGENFVCWQGDCFAAARIVYPDGHLYKLLSDVPTTNGPGWNDEGVDPGLISKWRIPIDPHLP